MMRAVMPVAGRAVVRTVKQPTPKPGHVLMKVLAAGLNRADLLQLHGRYAPPPGTTEILGLEAAGVLEDGSVAAALVSGGALAEYVSVPVRNVLQIPSLASQPEQLAAIPESFLVAHHLLFDCGKFNDGESVVVNAAGSGMGTAVIQLAKSLRDTRVFASARGAAKRRFVKERLGADVVVDPLASERELSNAVKVATNGRGADLVLDAVGADTFRENARSLRMDGAWVMYGLLSGSRSSDLTLAPLLMKRIQLITTTLRNRDIAYKSALIANFLASHSKKFETGEIGPVIARTYQGLERTMEALEYMESNENVGKIVVCV